MHRVPSVSGEQVTALRNAAEILCALSPLPPLDTAKPPVKGHPYNTGRHTTVIGIPVKQYEFEQVRATDALAGHNWRSDRPSRALPQARRLIDRVPATCWVAQALLRQRKATKVSPGSSPTAPHMLDQVMNERKGAKALSPNAMGAIPPCNHCGQMESPQWRKGPSACCAQPPPRHRRSQCTQEMPLRLLILLTTLRVAGGRQVTNHTSATRAAPATCEKARSTTAPTEEIAFTTRCSTRPSRTPPRWPHEKPRGPSAIASRGEHRFVYIRRRRLGASPLLDEVLTDTRRPCSILLTPVGDSPPAVSPTAAAAPGRRCTETRARSSTTTQQVPDRAHTRSVCPPADGNTSTFGNIFISLKNVYFQWDV
jgi:hypothetical protein